MRFLGAVRIYIVTTKKKMAKKIFKGIGKSTSNVKP